MACGSAPAVGCGPEGDRSRCRNPQMARMNKTRAHSRRGRPRHHRNPRLARLPIPSWHKSSAANPDTPASSPKAEKRERGQGSHRIVTGTKSGNDDVPKTRPASSGQSGKNRPDPNGIAWEIRVRPVQKTTTSTPAHGGQATAPSPFFATSASSFSDAPRGRFSPRSHWLTRPVVTLR